VLKQANKLSVGKLLEAKAFLFVSIKLVLFIQAAY